MRKPAGTPPRSGGRILIDQLVLHGVEVIFGVPGESYLAALDALRDSPIRFVNARHEAGAANMAEAAGKLTGRPGVCFVTRGPGATHGSVGVHTALPGLDAAGLPGRAGPARRARARSAAGGRLRGDVRAAREVGGADRRSGADPGDRPPRVRSRDLGTPGPGRALAAGGRARERRRPSPMLSATGRRSRGRPPPTSPRCERGSRALPRRW